MQRPSKQLSGKSDSAKKLRAQSPAPAGGRSHLISAEVLPSAGQPSSS